MTFDLRHTTLINNCESVDMECVCVWVREWEGDSSSIICRWLNSIALKGFTGTWHIWHFNLIESIFVTFDNTCWSWMLNILLTLLIQFNKRWLVEYRFEVCLVKFVLYESFSDFMEFPQISWNVCLIWFTNKTNPFALPFIDWKGCSLVVYLFTQNELSAHSTAFHWYALPLHAIQWLWLLSKFTRIAVSNISRQLDSNKVRWRRCAMRRPKHNNSVMFRNFHFRFSFLLWMHTEIQRQPSLFTDK